MIDLKLLQRQLVLPHLKNGGIAVDFTMGNGNDTLFLLQSLGENGHVYAFDIQDKALENTRKLIDENYNLKNYTLIKDSHSNLHNHVTAPICAGIFNLGYLPGSGNKELTTMRDTTLRAIDSALGLLADDGIIFISVYPGHAEGKIEGELIEEKYKNLNRQSYCFSSFKILNSVSSPYFMIIEKK